MFQNKILLFFLSAALLAACTPALRWRFAGPDDVVRQAPAAAEARGPQAPLNLRQACYAPEHYIPDTTLLAATPVKIIRINLHFVNSADSTHNYTGADARRFAQELVGSANTDLERNFKMWLPPNNETPVLPIRLRYAVTPDPDVPGDDGIYCHFDDDVCYYVHKGKNQNLLDRSVFNRYGVRPDSVLNIFLMPHHPDSVRSPTYSASSVGVSLGNAIKIAGPNENRGPGWNYRGVLNHEIGHVLGLSHAWAYDDGCADTPRHPGNCWNRSSTPPCDTMASNNVMDYNAMQHAWTPCQIGKVHAGMARETSRARQFLEPRWCIRRDDATVVIRDSVAWEGARDLEGDIIIETDAVLAVYCRVSIPPGGRITINPGGRLILYDTARLHNACDKLWEGILTLSQGKQKGEVVFVGEPQVENTRNFTRGAE